MPKPSKPGPKFQKPYDLDVNFSFSDREVAALAYAWFIARGQWPFLDDLVRVLISRRTTSLGKGPICERDYLHNAIMYEIDPTYDPSSRIKAGNIIKGRAYHIVEDRVISMASNLNLTETNRMIEEAAGLIILISQRINDPVFTPAFNSVVDTVRGALTFDHWSGITPVFDRQSGVGDHATFLNGCSGTCGSGKARFGRPSNAQSFGHQGSEVVDPNLK